MDLYRHFNSEGQLLYVGISNSTLVRLGAHRANAHWFNTITNVTVEKCTDRKDALHKEYTAIQDEHPLYNKMHNATEGTPEGNYSIYHPAHICPNGGIMMLTMRVFENTREIQFLDSEKFSSRLGKRYFHAIVELFKQFGVKVE